MPEFNLSTTYKAIAIGGVDLCLRLYLRQVGTEEELNRLLSHTGSPLSLIFTPHPFNWRARVLEMRGRGPVLLKR